MAEPIWVDKGWGHELWYHNDEKYCAKKLVFAAGSRCSLHYHRVKHETFVLESGRLILLLAPVMRGNVDVPMCDMRAIETIMLEPNERCYEVPPYTAHQMIALEDSKLVEFSTQHFDEDSVRIVKGD